MKSKTIVTLGILACLALLSGIYFYGCSNPPQMGSDDAVFRTVDALFTAVTARNEKLLVQCEAQLKVHKEEGKLPPSAAGYLANVIATARAGRWQPAAEKLYDFMIAQQRRGKRQG